MASVILLVGSNIDPEKNIPRAVRILQKVFAVQAVSTPWETPAVGSEGPNFINQAVLIETDAAPEQLKSECLRRLERQLGRVRTSDKNAPRTIDLDVITMNEVVVDPALWQHAHIALPVAELAPKLVHPVSLSSIGDVASTLLAASPAVPRADIYIRNL